MTGALTERERIDWLRLSRSENVGPITFRHLIGRYGSAAEALARLPELARRGGRRRPIRVPEVAAAEAELARLAAHGGRLLAAAEPDYPAALAAIDDRPPLIAVAGDAGLLARPCIAVVGARNASAAGRAFARRLAADLGQAGFVVVSGLARGIDGAAHRAALATGTAGVVAGGIDVVYPAEHAELQAEIAAAGCLVAEQPFATVPQARHFPRRNRLISGLALGVVVVEAALKSGSLITARLAGEQGRLVFAVPGSPLDPRARGANRLIRDGAELVESAADVVRALTPMIDRPWPLSEPVGPALGEPDTGDDDLDPRQVIGPTPVELDWLIRDLGRPAAEILGLILEWELAGRVERHAGNRVSAVYLPESSGRAQ